MGKYAIFRVPVNHPPAGFGLWTPYRTARGRMEGAYQRPRVWRRRVASIRVGRPKDDRPIASQGEHP